MGKKITKRWNSLRLQAQSRDDLSRTAALAVAAKCVEIALTAAGYPPINREGIQARLRRSGVLETSGLPSKKKIKEAFEARNQAIHSHDAPATNQCRSHLTTFYRTWCGLRKIFVSFQSAKLLADGFLTHPSINEVFLFGSLARKQPNPKDIDFLLFDDGSLSALKDSNWREYWEPDLMVEDELVDDVVFYSALRSGWINIVVVDGKRFGEDRAYTLRVWQNQADSLFFAKIASDLLYYNKRTQKWVDDAPQYFMRLKELRKLLEKDFIIYPSKM